MEVIAFVGPSGSGKSHRAIGVAHQYHCDAIIDDGLLIQGSKILGGTSAKSEQNRVQAVKRAIFYEDSHASAVREALARSSIRRILIIATSDRMISKITARLVLPDPLKTIYITDIASKQEIKKAHESRLRYGKHIVPVPTVELKQHFSGFFANLPYNIFSKNKNERRESRSIVKHNLCFREHHMTDNLVILLHHQVQFCDEVRVCSILIENIVFCASRAINIPECLTCKVLHLTLIFYLL